MVGPVELDPSLTVGQKLEAEGFPLVHISRPEVYYDGARWAEKLEAMVSGAKEYIIYTVFLGSRCEQSERIIALLEEKARSGVPVYLVYDGSGSFDMTESRYHLRPLSDLADSGIHLLEYHPFSVKRLVNLWNFIQREHRKFLVVDGVEVAIGGMNLNYISLGPLDAGGQRDTMYAFRSAEMAALLVDEFIDYWNSQSWEAVGPALFPKKARGEGEDLPAYYANQYNDDLKMPRLFGILINSAKKSIDSLPFLPYSDKTMLGVLSDAVKRGVDFRMVVPFDPRPMPRKATTYMLGDLVRTGVEVRMENPTKEARGLLHEKLLVADARYVCFGSSNFNFRSMALSNEIMLVLDDPDFAAEVLDHYNSLVEDTYVITQEEADGLRKPSNLLNYLFGFFGG